MATSIDLQRLFTEFNRIAFASSADGLAQLSSPGVEGLQIFLASGVYEIPVGVDEVRSGYQAKGWVENRSLTWSDVVSMVEYLMSLQLQKAVQIQVDSRVGDTCHFRGCLVSCKDEVRSIDDDGLFTSAERRMIASMKEITGHRDHGLRLLLMASWDLERATDLSLVIGPSAVETEQVAVEEHPPLAWQPERRWLPHLHECRVRSRVVCAWIRLQWCWRPPVDTFSAQSAGLLWRRRAMGGVLSAERPWHGRTR